MIEPECEVFEVLQNILRNKGSARGALMYLSFNDIINLICLLHNAIDGHTEDDLIQLTQQYKDQLADIKEMSLNMASDLEDRAAKLKGA